MDPHLCVFRNRDRVKREEMSSVAMLQKVWDCLILHLRLDMLDVIIFFFLGFVTEEEYNRTKRA
jgi:hypothetical protein